MGGNVIISANLPEAKRLLFEGKAQVIFSPRTAIPDLEVLPQRVKCDQTGVAVMTKRGSNLITWWNKAFRSFVSKGHYKQLCDEASRKYNSHMKCFEDTSRLPS